jgi:magnesium-transporting ATPase (P-type)
MDKILNILGTLKINKEWAHKKIYIVQYVFFYIISVVLLITNNIIMPETKSNKAKMTGFEILIWVSILVSIGVIMFFAFFVNGSINQEMTNLLKDDMDKISPEQLKLNLKLIEERANQIDNRRNILWGISLIPIIPIMIHLYNFFMNR